MKKRLVTRILSSILCISLLVVVLSACGGSDNSNTTSSSTDTGKPSTSSEIDSSSNETEEPYLVLKWADHNSDGSETAKSMDVMAEAVYKETNGRIKIDMYHGGVLGSFADSISMVESGVADIVWTSTSMFAGYFPYSEVFQLPMLGFTNAQSMTEAWWDMVEKFPEILDYEFKDYKLWMVHTSPAACIGANKTINSLEDLKGLNLRAAAGPAATMTRLWKANPVSMSPADMYLSMQKGVIDGYLFDGAGINTWGLAELTETIIDCGLSTNVDFILMNKDLWEKIKPEDQAIIDKIGGRVGSQTGATYMQNEADTLFADFKGDYRLITEDDPLYQELKQPLEGMYDEWVKAVNDGNYTSYDAQDILDFIKERAEFYSK